MPNAYLRIVTTDSNPKIFRDIARSTGSASKTISFGQVNLLKWGEKFGFDGT
jgi:hypothetical protein